MLNGEYKLFMSEEHYNRGSSSPLSTSIHLVSWDPPPPGFVKINVHGSLINSLASGRYIIPDWTGKLLKEGAANYGSTSILVAEARVLRGGVNAAIQVGFNNICIEGDNLILIQALKGNILVPW